MELQNEEVELPLCML